MHKKNLNGFYEFFARFKFSCCFLLGSRHLVSWFSVYVYSSKEVFSFLHRKKLIVMRKMNFKDSKQISSQTVFEHFTRNGALVNSHCFLFIDVKRSFSVVISFNLYSVFISAFALNRINLHLSILNQAGRL